MSLDQSPNISQPTTGGIAAHDSDPTEPKPGTATRGEPDTGDTNDGSKTGRSVERVEQPSRAVRRRGEGEEPDQDDETKTGRMAPRLE